MRSKLIGCGHDDVAHLALRDGALVNRTVLGDPQVAYGLDTAVASLRLNDALAGKDSFCGADRVERIAFAQSTTPLAIRTVDLPCLNVVLMQVALQAGAVGACA